MNVGIATELMNNLNMTERYQISSIEVFLKDIFVINPLTEINHESNHKAL